MQQERGKMDSYLAFSSYKIWEERWLQRGGPLEAGLGPSGYREEILTRMFENPEAPSINITE